MWKKILRRRKKNDTATTNTQLAPSSPTATTSTQLTPLSPSLLGIPREIRDRIYHHLIHPRGETLPYLYIKANGRDQRLSYCIERADQDPPLPRFRLLDLILLCRQIYNEVTPLFYSTNTFIIRPDNTVDFFSSLTPSTRCVIRSWGTDLFSLAGEEDVIRYYLEHQMDVKKILLADVLSFARQVDKETINIWKPMIQEFLLMPKLQSLVFLYDERGICQDKAFRNAIARLVKPHLVREWKQQGTVHLLETGLEIVKEGAASVSNKNLGPDSRPAKRMSRTTVHEPAEENREMAMEAVPVHGERSFTLPVLSGTGIGLFFPKHHSAKKSTHTQSQSLLFSKLAPELRTKIYIATFGSMVICVVMGDHSCGEDARRPDEDRPSSSRSDSGNPGSWRHLSNHSLPRGLYRGYNLLALLQTCRRVYIEGIELLYSTNTFIFNNNRHPALLDFPRAIPPKHWNSIRKLHLGWKFLTSPTVIEVGLSVRCKLQIEIDSTWFEVWKVVAGMRGLRECRIWCQLKCPPFCSRGTCYVRVGWVSMAQEEKLLEPLLAVGKLSPHGNENGGNSGHKSWNLKKMWNYRDNETGKEVETQKTSGAEDATEIVDPVRGRPAEDRTRLDIFQVVVPWTRERIDWLARGAPFRVVYGFRRESCGGHRVD